MKNLLNQLYELHPDADFFFWVPIKGGEMRVFVAFPNDDKESKEDYTLMTQEDVVDDSKMHAWFSHVYEYIKENNFNGRISLWTRNYLEEGVVNVVND